ncbi:hypothetical protein D3C71_1777360 [compost metagenome]
MLLNPTICVLLIPNLENAIEPSVISVQVIPSGEVNIPPLTHPIINKPLKYAIVCVCLVVLGKVITVQFPFALLYAT